MGYALCSLDNQTIIDRFGSTSYFSDVQRFCHKEFE
jgi:hypothetical protein